MFLIDRRVEKYSFFCFHVFHFYKMSYLISVCIIDLSYCTFLVFLCKKKKYIFWKCLEAAIVRMVIWDKLYVMIFCLLTPCVAISLPVISFFYDLIIDAPLQTKLTLK